MVIETINSANEVTYFFVSKSSGNTELYGLGNGDKIIISEQKGVST
jgi:hypothetical protein